MDLVVPRRMDWLPRDKHGRVVPWFVAFIDGEPDFRVARPGAIGDAVRGQLCWLCGHRMGTYSAFVVGPMCAVNRVTAEPPSHRECAIYAATACPFLANPSMKRRERGLPEERVDPAGVMIKRNPGVALVWVTRGWSMFPDPDGRAMFDIGKPDQTYWFAHGRAATRAEVVESIETGLPLLQEAAADDVELGELEAMTTLAMTLIPAR